MRGWALVMVCWLAAAAAPQPSDSGGSALAINDLRDADRAAYHGRYSEAIATDTKAIARSPDFAAAYYYRARHYDSAGRFDQAAADLDRVAAMHPDSQYVFLLRAEIALRRHDAAAALAELDQAARTPPASFWRQSFEAGANEEGQGHGIRHTASFHTASSLYAYRSIALELQGHDDAALADLQNALRNEVDNPEYVLGNHCYTAAIVGLLDMAELTCTQAIAHGTHDFGDYDSLGLVHLKMKAWDRAIADYTTALGNRPDLTLSLYGRGVARRARGDVSGGNADIEAARQGEPDIAGIMSRLGVAAP